MKKHFLIVFSFCQLLLVPATFCQSQNIIDSLRAVLKTNIKDHNKAFVLARLGWHVSYHDLNEGLKYAEQGLVLATRTNDTLEMADAYNVIGSIHMDLGNIPAAIDNLQKAILYNEILRDYRRAAVSASNLSIIYNRRREFKKAIEAGMKAYAYLKEDSYDALISTCINIGGTYMEMNSNDSAMYFLNKALDLCIRYNAGDSLQISSIYNSMADVYLNRNDLVQAKALSLKALGCVKDTTQYYYLCEHYITLAR
ncbi:MAG: tetratricopeptide repeat protein, partial [Bacteroidia bacterium]